MRSVGETLRSLNHDREPRHNLARENVVNIAAGGRSGFVVVAVVVVDDDNDDDDILLLPSAFVVCVQVIVSFFHVY